MSLLGEGGWCLLCCFKSAQVGTSLLVQWLRIRPPTAGDVSSIPARGTKIPHAARQLSPHATTTEPASSEARAL